MGGGYYYAKYSVTRLVFGQTDTQCLCIFLYLYIYIYLYNIYHICIKHKFLTAVVKYWTRIYNQQKLDTMLAHWIQCIIEHLLSVNLYFNCYPRRFLYEQLFVIFMVIEDNRWKNRFEANLNALWVDLVSSNIIVI